MSAPRIVRYKPGARINTRLVLEIVDLPRGLWEPIECAYPEVEAAGADASFRDEHNVTIFPPRFMTPRQFKQTERATRRGQHPRYEYWIDGKLAGLLIHVQGGYASLHIYRPWP